MINEVPKMNLLYDFPDIFTYYWVFVLVIGVVTFIGSVLIIILMVFIIRKIVKRNRQVYDNAVEMQEKALEEKECEFCGGLLKGTDRECPHCAAPIKYND